MIERVHIVEDWQREGHLVYFLGRQYPGAPRAILKPNGEWAELREADGMTYAPRGDDRAFYFAQGALDALMAQYRNVAAPHPATERHLNDAIEVRDRLLSLVEKRK